MSGTLTTSSYSPPCRTRAASTSCKRRASLAAKRKSHSSFSYALTPTETTYARPFAAVEGVGRELDPLRLPFGRAGPGPRQPHVVEGDCGLAGRRVCLHLAALRGRV